MQETAPIQDDPYFEVRSALVRRINQDRAAAGLDSVRLDALASQVGDRHCQEMAGRGYLSHWNLQGLLPYHRYHFAEGRDHVQENLSRTTVFSSQPNPISAEPQAILRPLLEAHQRYVDEQPPLDGHRRNVLDPAHTHVGIGLAVVGGEFTMAEEFVNRYVELAAFPETLPRGPVVVDGILLHSGFGPFYCAVFYEGWPVPRDVDALDRTYAYQDMAGDICARVPPWEMAFRPGNQRFRFNVPVEPRGPGYYHLVLWVRQPVRATPYQPSIGASQVDTKDGVPCTGWVFRRD